MIKPNKLLQTKPLHTQKLPKRRLFYMMITIAIMIALFNSLALANSAGQGGDTVTLHIFKIWDEDMRAVVVCRFIDADTNEAILNSITEAKKVGEQYDFRPFTNIPGYNFIGIDENYDQISGEVLERGIIVYMLYLPDIQPPNTEEPSETVTPPTEPDVPTPTTYTLVYNANADGDLVGNLPPPIEEIQEDTEVELSNEAPTRAGHRFIGWAPDPNASTAFYETGNMVNYIVIRENTELYAIWERTSFKITYNPGLKGSGSGMVDYVLFGNVYTIKDAIYAQVEPLFFYYIFDFWYTKISINEDDIGIRYEPSDEVEITEDLTLYAIWYNEG